MLAVLLVGLLVGAWTQVPGDGSKQDHNARQQQKTANSAKPVVALESPSGANKQEDANQQPTGYPWKELLAPANVPSWGLVLVGGIAGLLAYMTLRAIKKQAEIMESQATDARNSASSASATAQSTLGVIKQQTVHLRRQAAWQKMSAKGTLLSAKASLESAKAANAQIQVMKGKERARLAVRVFRLETLKFNSADWNNVRIEVENLGPTNAFNVRGTGGVNPIVEGIDPLEMEEENDIGIPTVIRPSPPVAETILQFFFPGEWFDELLMRPKIRLELKGIIRYEDVFGEQHFTKFEYEMRIPKWGILRSDNSAAVHPMSHWRKPDDPEANRAT